MKSVILTATILVFGCSTENVVQSSTMSLHDDTSEPQPGDVTGDFIATFHDNLEWNECLASVQEIEDLVITYEFDPLFGSTGGIVVVRANQTALDELQSHYCVLALEAERWNGPYPSIGVSN